MLITCDTLSLARPAPIARFNPVLHYLLRACLPGTPLLVACRLLPYTYHPAVAQHMAPSPSWLKHVTYHLIS